MTRPTPASVLHVTPTVSRRGGGVWQFVRDLASHQHRLGRRVAVAGLHDPDTDADTRDLPFPVYTPPRTGPRVLSFSLGLRHRLPELARGFDVIHVHGGLRMWPPVEAARAARRAGRRLVLSPHGMLYPWLLRRSRLRKRMLGLMFDDRMLRTPHVLHATCDQEAGFIRDYGLTQPVVVVPPGVDPPPPADGPVPVAVPEGARMCLFLGILEPKKGLPRLGEAWRRLKTSGGGGGWTLVVAGPDHSGQAEAFRRAAGEADVRLLGPVYGRDKWNLLHAADLFVLPTEWENFGLVVAEALACGTPTVTGVDTPWTWTPDAGCGWVVPPDVDALTAALREATSLPPQELSRRGDVGRRQVLSRYRWDEAVVGFDRLYDAAMC